MTSLSCMSTTASLQAEIERVGRQIFDLIDRKQTLANFLGQNAFQKWLMEWSMQNEEDRKSVV